MGNAAYDKERDWQMDRLVARLTDPEPDDRPLPRDEEAG